MYGYLVHFLSLLFSKTSFGATIPDSAHLSALSPDSAYPGLNATLANTSAVTYGSQGYYVGPPIASDRVICDATYGVNLDRDSCLDALQNFPWQDTCRILFAQRGTSFDVEQVLPLRISSSESFGQGLL